MKSGWGLLAEVGEAFGAEEFLELCGGEESVFEDEFGEVRVRLATLFAVVVGMMAVLKA